MRFGQQYLAFEPDNDLKVWDISFDSAFDLIIAANARNCFQISVELYYIVLQTIEQNIASVIRCSISEWWDFHWLYEHRAMGNEQFRSADPSIEWMPCINYYWASEKKRKEKKDSRPTNNVYKGSYKARREKRGKKSIEYLLYHKYIHRWRYFI